MRRQKKKIVQFQDINYNIEANWPKYVGSFITCVPTFDNQRNNQIQYGQQLEVSFKDTIVFIKRKIIELLKSKKEQVSQQQQLNQGNKKRQLKSKKKKKIFHRRSEKLKCLFSYLIADLQSKQAAEFKAYALQQSKKQDNLKIILDLIIKQQIFSEEYSEKIGIVENLESQIKQANQQFNKLKHTFEAEVKKYDGKLSQQETKILYQLKLMNSHPINENSFDLGYLKNFKQYYKKFQQIKEKKQRAKKNRSEIRQLYLTGKHARMATIFFMYLFGVKVKTPALIKPLFNRNIALLRYKHHQMHSHSLTVQKRQIEQVFEKSISQTTYLYPYVKNKQIFDYIEGFYEKEQSILKFSNNLNNYKNLKISNTSGVDELVNSPEHIEKLARNIIFNICKNNFSVERDDDDCVINSFNNSQKYLKAFGQPKIMKSILKMYQLQAVTWMKYREGRLSIHHLFNDDYKLMPQYDTSSYQRQLSPFWQEIQLMDKTIIYINHYTGQFSLTSKKWIPTRGGILADEMGLGKTIMTLGLIADDIEECEDNTNSMSKQFKGSNLIVVPVNVINQWQKQIQIHMNRKLKLYCYHEDSKKKYEDLTKYDIIFTTYTTLGLEYKKYRLQGNKIKQKNEKNERYLFDYYWRRIILDQAQNIKTRKSLMSEAAHILQSDFRWCLTGTPLQNNTEQLYSIVRFLKLQVFSQWLWWRQYVTNSQNTQDKYQILHTILKPIMLRRTKQTKYKEGEKIIQLPQKRIIIVRPQFNKAQRKNYDLLKQSSINHLKIMLKQASQSQYTHIFQIINRLRQFCSHPSLVLPNINIKEFQDENLIKKRIEAFFSKDLKVSKKFKQSLIDQLNNNQLYNCPICLEQDVDIFISVCGHKLCNQCLTKIINSTKNCPMCRKPINKKDVKLIQKKMEIENIYQQEIGSSKINSVMKTIYQIQERQEKCVIFSQWIKILDILGALCLKQKIKWTRIDGSLNKTVRTHNINQFKNNHNCRIIFISLKAGATGLNLTCANNVFIIDPWWNPAQEDQATQRVYRFGQTKAVNVYKFIMKDSIEERIIKMHEKKRKEMNEVLMNGKGGIQKKNEIEQMIQLLKD